MIFLHKPQQTVLRRALFQVHLWTGVGLAAYICVIGVTGAALVFRPEMQKATFAEYFYWRNFRGERISGRAMRQERLIRFP